MAKVYTKATATHQIPITVSFTCPKCRRAETVHKFAVIAGEATMRGYNNSMAGRAAENVLASSAEGQTADIEKRLRKGDIGMLCEEGKAMAFGKNIVCPECGLKQIPSAGGKKKTLWPKGFWLWLIPGYFVAATALGVLGKMSGGKTAGGLSGIALVAAVGCVFYFSNRSKKAYDDPALMEKAYKAAVNNEIRVSSPEFSDPAGFLINSEQ